jgi:DNA repair protein RadD
MTIELRDYQVDAIEALQEALGQGVERPLIVAPTGAGKTMLIAESIREWREANPDRRFLVLTHTKELVRQDYNALVTALGEENVGIYSAGLKRRDTHQPVIVGGIQSVANHRGALGRRDVVYIDEAHRLPRTGWGQYRSVIHSEEHPLGTEFIVGLTATPYRLDGGSLVEGEDAPFERIAYTIGVRRLIDAGWLSPLVPYAVRESFDTKGCKVSGGDFIQNERFEEVVNDDELLEKIVDGWIAKAKRADGQLRKTLVFCASLAQMGKVHGMIAERGIAARCISGDTPDAAGGESSRSLYEESEETRTGMIGGFRDGKITALLNCNVLTTGFDDPSIECILCLRPTMSAGLYVQMMGRGMRIAPGKKDCLVLDHGANVQRHGTIDDIHVPRPGQQRDTGTVRAIECEGCHTLYSVSAEGCPTCGLVRPKREREIAAGLTGDPAIDSLIATGEAKKRRVSGTTFLRHVSSSNNTVLRLTHALGATREVSEFFSLDGPHPYARAKARELWMDRFPGSPEVPRSVDEAIAMLREAPPHVWPTEVVIVKENGWDRVQLWIRGAAPGDPAEPDIYVTSGPLRDPLASSFGFKAEPPLRKGPDDQWMRDLTYWATTEEESPF